MSNIVTDANKEYVTIKIDTEMLVEMFEDSHGDYYKVIDKKQFATDIVGEITEALLSELETVIETFADSESCSIQVAEEE